MTTFDRRGFLKRSAAVTAGTLLTGAGTQALAARGALASHSPTGTSAPDNGGYGPIGPVPDRTTGRPLLHLPRDFEYASYGHEASYAAALGLPAAIGSDGYPTPGRHDGMAAFATADPDVVRLVRNHEQGYSTTANATRPYDAVLIGDPRNAYDEQAAGGCTTLTFDLRELRLLDSFISLSGTSVNCAGGIYGDSWLSCEETVNGRQNGFPEDHGYVFEVPSGGDRAVKNPRPYKEMGRFAHEAVAVDPSSGFVYETEDTGNSSGFYRFVPRNPRNLRAGGELQMLAIAGKPRFDTFRGVTDQVGHAMPVEWVPIADPDPDLITRSSVFSQGRELGGAAFGRLEGCWFDGGSIFFNATSGGDRGAGQVWEYRPRGTSAGQLVLLFESPSRELLDAPDNLTVSPRGGLVLCEDGGGEQFVRGLDPQGRIFSFAKNSTGGDNEFAGACFSPDGDVLFVNVQTPGVSFAIRGPWDRGSL